MKLKSKYSLIGIIVSAIAVLVMFLPCLNGVSIMQYVWFPATYETEYFKAPFTKGVARVNGSLKTIDSLVAKDGSEKVEGAAEYLEAYNEYMTELAGKEAEFKVIQAEYEVTAAKCEADKKALDNKISRYNRPVEEAGRVLSDMVNASENNEKAVASAINDINKAYKIIDAGETAKPQVVSVVKALAATYASTDEMKSASETAGKKVAELNSKNAVLDDANTASANEIKNNLANINRIENEFADIKTLAVYLYSRSSKEAPAAEEVAVFDVEYINNGSITYKDESGADAVYVLPEDEEENVYVVAKDTTPVLERIAAGKESVAAASAEDYAEGLRKRLDSELAAHDEEKIASDIEKLKKLHDSKIEELVNLVKSNVELEKAIAANKAEIEANNAEINAVKATKDYVSYEVVVLLNAINNDKSESEKSIAAAQEALRGCAKFDAVGTYEAVNAEEAIAAKAADFVAELKVSSEAAVEGKNVYDAIDFANLDTTDPVLKSVSEIVNRNFFETYYNNEQLVGDDESEFTYAESCAAVAKTLYLSPADKIALYEAIISNVQAVRDSNTEYAELKSAKSDNDELNISNKAKYDEAVSDMDSFIEAFESERVSSSIFALATEYKDLLIELYEDNAEIKSNKVELKVVKSDIKGLTKLLNKCPDVELIECDGTADDADAKVSAVNENIEMYKKEASLCEKFGINLEFYDSKIRTFVNKDGAVDSSNVKKATELVAWLQNYASLLHNNDSEAELTESTEQLKEDIVSTKDNIKELKSEEGKGLVEMQLSGSDYKTMVNDDEDQIDWYNYYINDEVSFFIYIMILFVVIVLFGLLVKFWQLDFIADVLMTIALIATVLCSDLLYVGNAPIFVIYVILTLASAYVTVMTLLEGLKKGNK